MAPSGLLVTTLQNDMAAEISSWPRVMRFVHSTAFRCGLQCAVGAVHASLVHAPSSWFKVLHAIICRCMQPLLRGFKPSVVISDRIWLHLDPSILYMQLTLCPLHAPHRPGAHVDSCFHSKPVIGAGLDWRHLGSYGAAVPLPGEQEVSPGGTARCGPTLLVYAC